MSFVLTTSDSGPIIVSHLDRHPEFGYGVGAEILDTGVYEPHISQAGLRMLELRRDDADRKGPVTAVDIGANVGFHTLTWARAMTSWGMVLAIEPQERLYYALAGNIALNNLWNVRALNAVIGSEEGRVTMPRLVYTEPGSYGSMEIVPTGRSEDVGQPVDRFVSDAAQVLPLDKILAGTASVDLLKIDVEGMEAAVLRGARVTLERFRPIILLETSKSDEGELTSILDDANYNWIAIDAMNKMAWHYDDKFNDTLTEFANSAQDASFGSAGVRKDDPASC